MKLYIGLGLGPAHAHGDQPAVVTSVHAQGSSGFGSKLHGSATQGRDTTANMKSSATTKCLSRALCGTVYCVPLLSLVWGAGGCPGGGAAAVGAGGVLCLRCSSEGTGCFFY